MQSGSRPYQVKIPNRNHFEGNVAGKRFQWDTNVTSVMTSKTIIKAKWECLVSFLKNGAVDGDGYFEIAQPGLHILETAQPTLQFLRLRILAGTFSRLPHKFWILKVCKAISRLHNFQNSVEHTYTESKDTTTKQGLKKNNTHRNILYHHMPCSKLVLLFLCQWRRASPAEPSDYWQRCVLCWDPALHYRRTC